MNTFPLMMFLHEYRYSHFLFLLSNFSPSIHQDYFNAIVPRKFGLSSHNSDIDF